jgi:DNA-binding response OmpR family regulator
MENISTQVAKNNINRSQIHLLLVEDNESLGEFLCDYLRAKGFHCVWTKDGEEALDEFYKGQTNFCLIDVMLPKKDGFSLAKDIRLQNKRIPILFLTAKDTEADRLKGFSVGADDYLSKPFSMEELIMRIQAIIRRLDATTDLVSDKIVLGRLSFDFSRRLVIVPPSGRDKFPKEISVSNKENEILKIFCQYKNEVIYRKVILEKVWHAENPYTTRSMDVYMSKIRKILAYDPNIDLVNIHGIGYKLNTKNNAIKGFEAFVGR